ncbi:MAG: hypothetical protein AB7V55_07290 [Oscillospiraceae bacterium]
MRQEENRRASWPVSVWVAALLCVSIVIFTLCSGAAYASVRQANMTAAKASIGQVEAVLNLAQCKAEADGLGAPATSFSTLIKSYDEAGAAVLPEYERYVLSAMLESFGPARDFDFAFSRFEDGAGVHTQVYFFPTRGKTDIKADRYYLFSAGVLSENN